MNVCKNCGTQFEGSFCSECGTSFTPTPTPTVPAPTPAPMPTPKKTSVLAIISLVLGIVGLLLACFTFGGILGIIGLILGIIALIKKQEGKVLAVIGVILNSIAIIIMVVMIIAANFFVKTVNSILDTSQIYDYVDYQIESTPESALDDLETFVDSPDTTFDSLDAETSKEQAVLKAKSLLASYPFSYSELVARLEYEDFNTEDAIYGADNCGADWSEQARLYALAYLSTGAFSYQEMVEQLKGIGFTRKEAKYGADMCGADWFEQASLMAASFLSYSSPSREELIEPLEEVGYTHEEAVYAADENGL